MVFYKFIEHSNINITLYKITRHKEMFVNKQNIDVNVYKDE